MTIPFHKAHITDEEVAAVTETLRSGWLTMGPKCIQFEKEFCEYLGVPQGVLMNSATACLHLALKAIGLKRGDEVIIPTTTFIATAEVITYFDAIPVLCDVQADTHNIDPQKIEALITEKTRAIIPVHFAGRPCDMDAISEIAKRHQLAVIEDAAHAIPSTYKGQKIGTLSDITCFSFYATKTLAMGEGGLAATRNEEYANTMRVNRLHGMSKDAWNRYTGKGSWYYEVVDNGCKYNATDLAAALGLVQLKKVEWMGQERRRIAAYYDRVFAGSSIQLPAPDSDSYQSAWHLYVIKVKNRNDVIEMLKADGVIASVHFIPVHKHPWYKEKYGYRDTDFPVANAVYEGSLSLPIYPGLTASDLEKISSAVLKHAQ